MNTFSPSREIRKIRYEWKTGGPVVTNAIIALCIIVWVVEELAWLFNQNMLMWLENYFAFIPAMTTSAPWIALTSMFMHAAGTDFWHIVCNMISLWFIGPALERVYGHWQYLALYLTCGLGGDAGLMTYARCVDTVPAWLSSSWGASGAIFGLMGSLLVIYKQSKMDMIQLIIVVVMNLAMPLFVPNVAWQAHVGGLLTGMAATALMSGRLPFMRAMNYVKRVAVSVGALLVVVLVVFVVCNGTSSIPRLVSSLSF